MHILLLRISMRKEVFDMTNENMQGVNTAVGCNVTGCKYNRAGDYCTLARIHVGKACDGQQCTCCDSYEGK